MAGELWQQAAGWLASIGSLPPRSPALKPDARVYDLALALQDGTVLCATMEKIQPGILEGYSEQPAKQFLKIQNINAFLEKLAVFKVPPNKAFLADELYYASDFQKVITCLAMLSNSKQAKSAGFTPFGSSGAHTADDGGEDMYQTLEDLMQQSISFKDAEGDAAQYDPEGPEENDEDIYGAIRGVIQDTGGEEEDIYNDILYSGRAAPTRGGAAAQESIYSSGAPDDARNHVLNELIETERNYCGVLDLLSNSFKAPLSTKGGLDAGDILTIFSNVEELLAVHTTFIEELDRIMGLKTGRNVSQAFLPTLSKMRVYGRFCCDIPVAINKVREMEAKKKGRDLLEATRKASGQKFKLQDLLNVPMQRILKYPLLIKELIKHTPDTHPDKENLTHTLQDVNELAKHINDEKRRNDELKVMMAGLKKYKGPPITAFAPLQRDGDLMHKFEDGKDKLKVKYCFLLAKAVIFTAQSGTKFTWLHTLEFSPEMEVADMPFWTLPKDEQNSKYSFAWKVTQGGKDVHIFVAKSLQMKKKWMDATKQVLSDLRDASVAAPEPSRRDSTRPPLPNPSASGGGPSTGRSSGGGAAAANPAKSGKGKGSYEEWTPTGKARPAADGTRRDAAPAISDDSFFAGRMGRTKVEKLFANAPNGAFLVRESETRQGDYSLSVKYEIVKHIKINRHGNKYDIAPDAKAFPSIVELVEHFTHHSLNRHFPGMETTLAHPYKNVVSRGKQGLHGREKAVGIGRCRSRFAYVARSHDELSFERGVEIQILSEEGQDPGWWKGQLPNGHIGIFPANYVQKL